MPNYKIELTNLDQTLSITTSINNPIQAILIDSWSNRQNIKSSNLCTHQAYVPMEILEYNHVTDERTKTYNIPGKLLGLDKFYGVYFVTVLFVDDELNNTCADDLAVIFNDGMMYGFRLQIMTDTCITCMDLNNYQKLAVLQFREMMFRDLVKLGRIDDAIYYFGEILRLMSEHKQVFEDINFKRCLEGTWGCHLNVSLVGNDFPDNVCYDDSCNVTTVQP